VLYLDKGFCSGDIIDYFQTARLPALIACPIRGKAGKGERVPCVMVVSIYTTRYTFTDGTTAQLAVVPTLKRQKKTGKQRRTWLVYVLINLHWSAKYAMQRYPAALALNRPTVNSVRCAFILMLAIRLSAFLSGAGLVLAQCLDFSTLS